MDTGPDPAIDRSAPTRKPRRFPAMRQRWARVERYVLYAHARGKRVCG